jgi:hypothetical protein
MPAALVSRSIVPTNARERGRMAAMFADQEGPIAGSPPDEPEPADAHPDEGSDPVVRLQRLAELREQGLLTDEEFVAEKRSILQS